MDAEDILAQSVGIFVVDVMKLRQRRKLKERRNLTTPASRRRMTKPYYQDSKVNDAKH